MRVMPYPLRVELVLPPAYSRIKAQAFLDEKQAWIAAQSQCFPPAIVLESGAVVPVLGRKVVIAHSGSVRGLPRWEEDRLIISGLEEQVALRVKRALIQRLGVFIAEKAAHYAHMLGCSYQRIMLKDTSSRWGSCSSQGSLAFCWKLVFAPPDVLDYVIAHEVAHLIEMNHSARFWWLVARLCPGFTHQRTWLKCHGVTLHRYVLHADRPRT